MIEGNISRKYTEHIDLFFDKGLHIGTRTVSLMSGTTDENMLETLVKSMHILERINHDPIIVYMNNDGGQVKEGLAIYDTIKRSPCYIRMFVRGSASSSGSLILQAADKRIMSPNSEMLLHYGQMGDLGDEWESAENLLKYEKETKIMMEDIYLEKIRDKNPDYHRNKIKRLLKYDIVLRPKEALSLGLIDEIER